MAVDEPLFGALAKARALGFLGPGPVEAHIEHAEAFVRLVRARSLSGAGLDLGSGGGIPGLVLAWRLPEWRWTLVDIARRRTSFLVAAVAELGLAGRVTVVRDRAELLGHDPNHRAAYDVVTARSFAPPSVTAEVGGAFLRVGAALLVAEPPDNIDRWEPAVLQQLGLEDRGVTVAPAIRTLERVSPVRPDVPRETVFRKPLD